MPTRTGCFVFQTSDENVTENIFMPLPGIRSIFYYLPFDVMQAHAKSLNERFRTLISLIFGLAIGCSLLFGASRWETSPLIEERPA